ncbi:unnamed protein product [Pseudo-nitzschia multistriata]|uniref:Uncharacterized protein n=1 Tax=Pseudo-nitzschia multistriata TaxID=183589 RepID=A0A448Z2M2_9STRA|nr:unnamed protein product [Pseudo-nitzschia multistriata]
MANVPGTTRDEKNDNGLSPVVAPDSSSLLEATGADITPNPPNPPNVIQAPEEEIFFDDQADLPPMEKKVVGAAGQLTTAEMLELTLDRNFQMSRLATQYYYTRHFWMMFLPSVSITMISGIMAFMIKSEITMSETVSNWIAFLVGSFSIMNVFLQNLSNELNYDHCCKSQRAVSLGLKRILAEMEFHKSTTGGIPIEKIHEIEKTMNTIMGQNDATVPAAITSAYELAKTRLSLRLFPPVRFDDNDPYASNKLSWSQTMHTVHNELLCAIANSPGWPLRIPNAEEVVQIAIQRVVEILKEEQHNELYKALLDGQELIRVKNIENKRKRKKERLRSAIGAFSGIASAMRKNEKIKGWSSNRTTDESTALLEKAPENSGGQKYWSMLANGTSNHDNNYDSSIP